MTRTPLRRFSFEELPSAAEERLSMGGFLEASDSVARTVSVGSSGRSSVGSEDEAVTPVDLQTPMEYRQQQADALRELLGLVEAKDVERMVAEFGLGCGEELKDAAEVGVVEIGQVKAAMGWNEDEGVMAARGLARLGAEDYLAETEGSRQLLF